MSEPSEALLAEAKQMGWVPKDEFRGDQSKWTDAETFVKRGRENIPILVANNRRLMGEVGRLNGQVNELTTAVNESKEAIAALKEHNSEANRQALKETKTQIAARLVQARRDGDVEAETELQEQLTDTTVALRESEAAPKKEDTPPKPNGSPPNQPLAPEFVEWQGQNEWFGVDVRKSGIAIAIANEMRQDPSLKHLVGTKKFYDHLDAELEKTFGGNQNRNASSKVGDGGIGGGGNGGGGGKSYNDLPAEAKAICQRQASRLVGPNRAFATIKEWETKYAADYFADEE